MSRLLYNRRAKAWAAFVVLAGLLLADCSSREQRAQNYYESGMKFLADQENQKAAVEFRNAVKLKADLLPAWQGLARAEEATHHWEGLAGALRTILELDPKDDIARVKLARLLLAGGGVNQALKLVNDAAAPDANADLHALKAAISYRLKDSAAAVQEAQAALKIQPDNPGAIAVLAADRLDNNDPRSALELLPKDSAALDKDLGLELLKIKAYDQLKDYPQIEALLKKLSELYPQQVAFRKQLVKFYINQQRPQDAEKELRAIVAADPKTVEAESDLVRFLFATKGAAAARDELVTRIKAGGDIFPFELALAELDYDQGRVSDSIRLLESLGEKASPENAVKAKIKLAELNLRQKNTDAAEKIITDVLAKDSRNVDALKLRASIRLGREQFETAISDLREALNDQPRSIEPMLLLATAYERSGSIELADKQFADAIKASKFNVAVGLAYVSFLRRHGGIDRSYDFLTELANRWPNNVQVLSALAEAKLARQDWAGAQEIGEKIQRVSKARGMGDLILGAAMSGEHKNDESIAAFQDAVAADPAAAQPMIALVGALVRANKADRAVAFLQNVLKENPASAEAYVLLGSIALTNNKLDDAEKDFRAAIARQPKDATGYSALADLDIRQKNLDGALDVLRLGLKEQPDSSNLHLALAGALERKGDYEAAISEYEYLIKQQPGSMVIINNLASLLTDRRTDKASLDRARVLAASLRESQVPQFKDTLGWINYRQGDFKTAVPLLEAAAASLPNAASVHYHLGMSYVAISEIAKASAQFNEALARGPDEELEVKIKTELNKIAVQ